MNLMDSPLRLLFVFLVFSPAWAEINNDVCTPVEWSCGPVLPVLPVNFELKGGYVDKEKKAVAYEEMYFDFDNLRAKYVVLVNAVELHLIFDYNVSQVIEYYIVHSGSSTKDDPLSFGCSAEDIEYSVHKNIFGYRYGVQGTPMFDSTHVLRFGGPFQYAYNGSSGNTDRNDESDDGSDDSDDGRGLLWDAFIGCIYEREVEYTALVRYKFSGVKMATSANSVKGDVDGSGRNDSLPVPIAADYKGIALIKDPAGNTSRYIPFDVSQSYSWFKANPIFDNKNFQIPPWMHCDNYMGWKRMPDFPMAFSLRMEVVSSVQDISGKNAAQELVSVDQLYYYNEKGLARRDFTPHPEKDSDIINKFGNGGPVKTIYDYTTLRVYIVSKTTGRCYTKQIGETDYFTSPYGGISTKMVTPEELFYMKQDDMEYKGQYFTRDIECDVWSGKYYDKALNLTVYKETYMSTNGWHSEADERVQYSAPIKHTVITNRSDKKFYRYVTETNFFKFKGYPPILVSFDVRECVETIEHKFFAIKLFVPEGDPQTMLQTYKFVFLEYAQYYLATASDLASPLRIQRIALSISKVGVILTFAMVEKPGDSILNPTKGVAVEDAAEKLRTVVNEGNFEILFPHPETLEPIPIIAEPGNFFNWYPGGNTTNLSKIKKPSAGIFDRQQPHSIHGHFMEEEEDEEIFFAETDTTVSSAPAKKGMSPGALGGLSVGMLLIGIAIGIAVMYLYIRKYGNLSDSNDYVMHTTS